MYDVVFCEVFSEEESILRELLPNSINAYFTKKTFQEENVEGKLLCIRTQSKVPEYSNVISRSTGINHLDNHKGIKTNIPNYSTTAVAEHAIMLMMCLLKNLKKQLNNVKSFDRDNLTGRECLNKTVLIAGVGKIGYEISKICKAFGMNVIGVDIFKNYGDINYMDINEGIPKSDVIICSMNLNNNEGYFNYNLLKNSKKRAVFVNISRGEISPMSDILKLLDENHLGGVALDVFSDESNLYVSGGNNNVFQDLLKRDNVLFTPHNAFNSEEALRRKCEYNVKYVVGFLENEKFI